LSDFVVAHPARKSEQREQSKGDGHAFEENVTTPTHELKPLLSSSITQ
jgi:hypothetical protein